jgi:2-keto-4-pentenoate hydratase/2-oxohepta-3-ene-1,7-dioic acid hydratase in catechol pathway
MQLLYGRIGIDDNQLFTAVGDRFVPLSAIPDAARLLPDSCCDVGQVLREGVWAALAETLRISSVPDFAPTFTADQIHVEPPIIAPAKIICVGHNYAAHAEESDQEPPSQPVLFAKTSNTLVGHGATIDYPSSLTAELDYEGELAVIIGRAGSHIRREKALEYVAGYTIYNDLTARDVQLASSQWFRGKSLDRTGPLGPSVVSTDELRDTTGLTLETRVNGEVRQSARCGDMIFSPAALIAFISNGISLEPGDVIATGTPAGVGHSFRPPRFLAPGDVVEVTITALGTLRTKIAE